MSLDRANLLQGPAKIVFGGGTFFSEGDIVVEPVIERADRNVSGFGIQKRPIIDKLVKVRFTPVQWDNLAVLFPYGSTAIGTNIFGTTDGSCVITPTDGSPLTLANVAVTRMPSAPLGVGGNTLGEVELTALIANDSEADALASYLSQASVASGVALTGFDPSKVINDAYTAVYNSVTYHSETPFQIDFDLQLSPRKVEGLGTVAMILTGVSASCRFRPVGVTEANYLGLMGMATAMGTEPTRYNLVVAGANAGSPSIQLNSCVVEPGSKVYGADANRLGELNFTTVRTQTSGALDALFSVGTVSE